jgi:hypothetical protein
MDRHFSAFPLTSHLHKPALRLVSLHPLLSLTVTFVRVPQIHDGFEWNVFMSRDTTVEAVVDLIVNDLSLSRNLPVLGSTNFEYVLEEVWTEGSAESKTLLLKYRYKSFLLNHCQNSQNSLLQLWLLRSLKPPSYLTHFVPPHDGHFVFAFQTSGSVARSLDVLPQYPPSHLNRQPNN